MNQPTLEEARAEFDRIRALGRRLSLILDRDLMPRNRERFQGQHDYIVRAVEEAQRTTFCPKCGYELTHMMLCPSCGVRYDEWTVTPPVEVLDAAPAGDALAGEAVGDRRITTIQAVTFDDDDAPIFTMFEEEDFRKHVGHTIECIKSERDAEVWCRDCDLILCHTSVLEAGDDDA